MQADAEWNTSWHRYVHPLRIPPKPLILLRSGWSRHVYDPGFFFERLLAEASVEQRCLLSWPAPGHRYWCEETLAAVARRYGPLGFDAAPYLAGARAAGARL